MFLGLAEAGEKEEDAVAVDTSVAAVAEIMVADANTTRYI